MANITGIDFNRALSKFILIEINLMRMPLEERNTSIKTRIEKRKATAARKDAELKQAAEELAIQEQKAAEELVIQEQTY